MEKKQSIGREKIWAGKKKQKHAKKEKVRQE